MTYLWPKPFGGGMHVSDTPISSLWKSAACCKEGKKVYGFVDLSYIDTTLQDQA